MVFIRYSFIFIFFLISESFAQSRFNSQSCLSASYKMKMTQKGPLFGLIHQELVIDKKNCIIHISHKKYFPREWVVDVCREPVHIKVTSATGVDIAKKDADCIKKDQSRDTGNFCSQYFTMMDVVQDDGLIFAEGDRDSLSSPHGKTYCSYLLLKRYLLDSIVFSRYTEIPDIFIDKTKETFTVEPVTPLEEEIKEVKEEIKEQVKVDGTSLQPNSQAI